MASEKVSLLLFPPMDGISSHRCKGEAPAHPSYLLALILWLLNTHIINITLQRIADYQGQRQPSLLMGEDLI